jgi:hypothetical protein
MKKYLSIIGIVLLLSCFNSCEEITNITNNTTLTDAEITQGLKEALRVGTDTSTANAHKTDGYFKNVKIKIPFPPEAQYAETTLRSVLGNSLVDEFVLKLNRAAEDAADDAKSIFINALTNMTIDDALNILKGSNNAATNYLRLKTFDSLRIIFKPQINGSLSSVGASQAWSSLTSTYNNIPFVTPINTDLSDYTTTKALDGLFILIADEELKIRTDPVARVTDILKKVFGN